MRFISKYAKYALQVRPQVVEAYATGATKIVQEQLVARFSIGEVTGDERSLARQYFAFNGFYQEEDLVTIVEPDYRISAFDSLKAQAQEGWTDEEREWVEKALLREAELDPQSLVAIEAKRATPPWPTYDAFTGTPAALCKKIEEDGYEFLAVLNYERENQNRPEVIAKLELACDLDDEGLRMGDQMPEEELVG
jgi:hypothetical protein